MPETRPILDMNAFAADRDGGGDNPLLQRRLANLGAASVLFYRQPIEMVRARGAWMEAADGRRYLDFYNNVPSVGHCHPGVVAAICRQVAELNIHTRYLNEAVDAYLEALKATLPPDLSNVALACSGSEANDLAMRVAMAVTGGSGFIVTETAYHGNTAAVTEVSPSALKQRPPRDHVAIVPAPGSDAFGDDIAGGFAAAVAGAIRVLEGRGHRLAALICDSIFSSDGVFADPPQFLAPAVAIVQAAGGLYIADEVQPGFARTGAAFWGFERHGVAPDIVTMGKPMGNGFPMAGMATRPDFLARFCAEIGYFNTFAGNPVAAAAGLAVLEAIAADGLQANARAVGGHLMRRLQALAAVEPRLGAVRGAGLFLGIDLVRPAAAGDPAGEVAQAAPDPALAAALINGLRDRGVLIGAAGRYGHTLKIRPPLCLTLAEADLFVDALAEALADPLTARTAG